MYSLIYTPESDGSVRRDFSVADTKKGGRIMETIVVPFVEQNSRKNNTAERVTEK